MSVAHIGTTRRLGLNAYLDERDPRVFRGRIDLVIDELQHKAKEMGIQNRKVLYSKYDIPSIYGVFGVITVVGDVKVTE